jgi:hypothetical protein
MTRPWWVAGIAVRVCSETARLLAGMMDSRRASV